MINIQIPYYRKEVTIMRTCHNCGATVDNNASYCLSCGSAVISQPAAQTPVKESISVGGWIGRSLIPCIPLVGSIIYLVMLFIWSGDKTKEDTFRNWAKAQLIIMLIAVILTVIVTVLFGATIFTLVESYY